MAYNSKYTGAQVEALLDRAGAAPQIYDIGWLMNLISASGNGTATLTAEQFNEVKAATDVGKTFMAHGEVYSTITTTSEDNTIIALVRLYSLYLSHNGVILLSVISLNGTQAASNSVEFVTQDDLTGYAKSSDVPTKTSQLTNDSGFAKASDVPTKTSQLTNDSGFLTENQILDGYVRKGEVVKKYPDTIGYGNSYTAMTPTIELAADKFNIVGRCSGLTLTLPAGADMDGQEYRCQFYVPNSQYTLTVPADVRWQNGEVPTFEGNTCCQLVIVNNCATIGVFKASS